MLNSNNPATNDSVVTSTTDALLSENGEGSILSALLDQVISATRSGDDAHEAPSEVTRRFNQIAKHSPHQQLSLDPVLISLVDAVTCDIHGLTPDQRSAMNRAVAQTLHGNSDTRLRLERLWNGLGENDGKS